MYKLRNLVFVINILLLTINYKTNAQDYQLAFSVLGDVEYPDSVFVENVEQKTSIMLKGGDILHLTKSTTVNKVNSAKENIKVYPNPAQKTATIEFYNTVSGDISLSVFDLNGKLIVSNTEFSSTGRNRYYITGLNTGINVVHIKTSDNQYSAIILSHFTSGGATAIERINPGLSQGNSYLLKSANTPAEMIEMEYNDGEKLQLTAYLFSENFIEELIPANSQTITFDFSAYNPVALFATSKTSVLTGDRILFADQSLNNPTGWLWDLGDGSTSASQNTTYDYSAAGTYSVSLTVTNEFGSDTETKVDLITVTGIDIVFNPGLSYGTVTDIEGNSYKTIKIGTQEWMAENLKTTKYNDDTAIPLVTDPTEWLDLSTAAYCWYDNDQTSYQPKYGALYNWYVVETAKLCPTGWHVPDDSEWTILTDYLGGEDIAGGKLKETSSGHWTDPNQGASNESGFTALPGGFKNFDYNQGNFLGIGYLGYWWSATENSSQSAWHRHLYYDASYVINNYVTKRNGYSVRCLKDSVYQTNQPAADFQADKTTITKGDTIQFTDQSTNSPNSWNWDFGDGGTSNLQNPSHIYEETGIYTVSLTIHNQDGSDATTKLDFVTVNDEGAGESHINFNPSLTYGSVTDKAGNTYRTIAIGEQDWMAENLRYETTSGSWFFGNDTSNAFYGRLYNWWAALEGCPDGWHLPSEKEWQILREFLGGSDVAGGKMKERGTSHWTYPNEGATNESGFTALPAGYRNTNPYFVGLGGTTGYWSSTVVGANYAVIPVLLNNRASLGVFTPSRNFGYSVRYIRDYPAGVYPQWIIGDYNDWENNDNAGLILTSLVSEGVASGYLWLSEGGIKFVVNHSGDDASIYGDNGAGGLASPGNEIIVPSDAYYRITTNLSEMAYSLDPTSWGVLGDATPGDWDEDTDLSYDADSRMWIGAVNLKGSGSYKFRANDSWDLNYGGDIVNGMVEDGGNIPAPTTAGDYAVSLDLSTPNDYTAEVHRWGVLGDATPGGWDTDIDMTWDSDNGVFTVTVELTAASIKFRADDSWDVNLGGVLSALSWSGDNIPVANAGTYVITLNPWTRVATMVSQ